jgi:hypothetical protein
MNGKFKHTLDIKPELQYETHDEVISYADSLIVYSSVSQTGGSRSDLWWVPKSF